MTSFTPMAALIGGMIIGLAAAVLLIGNGDIMGASGIVNNLFINLMGNLSLPAAAATATASSSSSQSAISSSKDHGGKNNWEFLFIVAFGLSANIIEALRHPGFLRKLLIFPVDSVSDTYVSVVGYIVAGFFTGFGTKLSNGCTSGHGICGMARFSLRSTVAVCCFMSVGFLTASLCDPENFLIFRFMRTTYPMIAPNWLSKTIALTIIFIMLIYAIKVLKDDDPIEDDQEAMMNESSSLQPSSGGASNREEIRLLAKQKIVATILSAFLFALGLAISSMVNNCKIIDFLDLSLIPRGEWDPSLVFVMGGGLIISALSYQFVEGYNFVLSNDKALSSPIMYTGKDFDIPKGSSIDKNLILGSLTFGFGWGVGGLCPGPAAYQALLGQPQTMFLYGPAFLLGTKLATMIEF